MKVSEGEPLLIQASSLTQFNHLTGDSPLERCLPLTRLDHRMPGQEQLNANLASRTRHFVCRRSVQSPRRSVHALRSSAFHASLHIDMPPPDTGTTVQLWLLDGSPQDVGHVTINRAALYHAVSTQLQRGCHPFEVVVAADATSLKLTMNLWSQLASKLNSTHDFDFGVLWRRATLPMLQRQTQHKRL